SLSRASPQWTGGGSARWGRRAARRGGRRRVSGVLLRAQDAPTALVACYQWDHYVDLLTIRDFDRVTTARVPTHGRRVDIFAPEIVVWAYQGPPQQALRALLHLLHPTHPQAPTAGYPAPTSLHIPRAQQRPMTIQLPSPHRAAVRAARLATAMTAHGGDRVLSATGPAGTPENRRLVAGLSERPPTLGSRRPAGHQPNPSEREVRPCPSDDPDRSMTGGAMPQAPPFLNSAESSRSR
ncbi:MAG TPA: hypothetical protein VJT72_19180, partial [Pseudonocardiaceae bacterium]|nr:hypothetical protein [Pseudonocardiaceae bacterium]